MSSKSSQAPIEVRPLHRPTPVSFAAWRSNTLAAGLRPIVVVAGSRGKTTVVRLLDAIFKEAGLRTAIWTDRGVEIDGAPQRGELVPWTRVGARLDEGTLDVAVREVGWSTFRTAGLPPGSMPVVVVTNVCANREACLIRGEAKLAAQTLPVLLHVASPDGLVVLNGEDYAVSGDEVPRDRPQWLVALSRVTPLVREHIAAGGAAAWVENGSLRVDDSAVVKDVGRTDGLVFALNGASGFQVHNALSAAAVATALGIGAREIAAALCAFRSSPRSMPGSFNIVEVNGTTAIVDRPQPSWFLRSVLRAVKDRAAGRVITVAGRLDPVPDSDLAEVGRLLGRASSALVLHSQSARTERAASFRQGVALSDVPPPIVHTPTERRAIARALAMARPRDILLVLADKPLPALRLLTRATQAGSRDMLAAD
jgi:UDP-N-acetylmuramyl tripeptide synthase